MPRFLLNGLSGREALLIDPAKANDHRVLAEKFGFTDMLAQLFGEVPKAYIAEDERVMASGRPLADAAGWPST